MRQVALGFVIGVGAVINLCAALMVQQAEPANRLLRECEAQRVAGEVCVMRFDQQPAA